MPQELTTEYNMENWREATKDWTFIPYSIEGYGELSGTICVGDVSVPGEPYERTDFDYGFCFNTQSPNEGRICFEHGGCKNHSDLKG